MNEPIFLDHASTTRCSATAADLIRRYALIDFGNPGSTHRMGQEAARAIRDARNFFASHFNVEPEQIVFTSSGTESDNLAVMGVALDAVTRRLPTPRVLVSAIEHSAVKRAASSLSGFGMDTQFIPVDSSARVIPEKLDELLTAQTILVSIMHANNIVGSIQPIEELARRVKSKVPAAIVHTDAVQSFGKVPVMPSSGSSVDLVSISAHKVHGPKGAGALIVLNKSLLKSGLRPLLYGGGQEAGFRSGTQNVGLIAGFRAAAEETLKNQAAETRHVLLLRARLEEQLRAASLLTDDGTSRIRWNSPSSDMLPHVVSLSVPGFPSGPLARLIEERGFLVSTGSACSAHKTEPEPVLKAMGLPPDVQTSAIRVSFSQDNTLDHIDAFVVALADSIDTMRKLAGHKKGR